MPSAIPRRSGSTRSRTYEKFAMKNAEKPEPLQNADDDEERNAVRDGGEERGERHAHDAGEHERLAPERIHPRPSSGWTTMPTAL
jgi:hypothetical protein